MDFEGGVLYRDEYQAQFYIQEMYLQNVTINDMHPFLLLHE